MTIKMPVVIGIHAHPSLHIKVDQAIADKNYPVVLDCEHTTFMTSMFYRFAIGVFKKVKAAGGTMHVINVDEVLYDALILCNVDKIMLVSKKGADNGGKH